MAILAECPICHRKQRIKNKVCPCGEDMDKAKRSKKVRYWINYQVAGIQKRYLVGFSIEDAKAKERDVLVQRENDPQSLIRDRTMTFNDLAQWYLQLKSVQSLAYFRTMQIYVRKFCAEYGPRHVVSLKPSDLENLQFKRKEQGYAASTVDQEIMIARAMVTKGFHNDLVDFTVTGVFKRVKKLMKANANARDRILTPEEFHALCAHAPRHVRDIIVVAYYTGMREGEILNLTWEKMDLKGRVIRLDASDTKDREKRTIPICDELYAVLKAIPRSLDPQAKVFTYNGKTITNMHRWIKQACAAAGIIYGKGVKDGFIFHDLRHCFNTNMRKAGVAESVIMSITGHSTRAMFDRYNTVDHADKAHAVSVLASYLNRLDQGLDQEGSKPLL